jgi:hypothetical protein
MGISSSGCMTTASAEELPVDRQWLRYVVNDSGTAAVLEATGVLLEDDDISQRQFYKSTLLMYIQSRIYTHGSQRIRLNIFDAPASWGDKFK